MSADSDATLPNSTDASSEASVPAVNVEPQRKSRLAVFIATACGLGYIPVAPGTFGSLAGLVLALIPFFTFAIFSFLYVPDKPGDAASLSWLMSTNRDPVLWGQICVAILVALVGVWGATRAATFWQQSDPQRVVIDEVSGQHLTLLLGCGVPVWWKTLQYPVESGSLSWISLRSPLNWKYLLLSFILFRVFDIWKPFPARQAESLPGGWGIMADDWVAGIYAAIGLWLARSAGF